LPVLAAAAAVPTGLRAAAAGVPTGLRAAAAGVATVTKKMLMQVTAAFATGTKLLAREKTAAAAAAAAAAAEVATVTKIRRKVPLHSSLSKLLSLSNPPCIVHF